MTSPLGRPPLATATALDKRDQRSQTRHIVFFEVAQFGVGELKFAQALAHDLVNGLSLG